MDPGDEGGFPLPAADVANVFEALRREAPPLARETYTSPVPGRAGRPDATLRAVAVHKRRVRYMIGGCTAEVTEVSTGQGNPNDRHRVRGPGRGDRDGPSVGLAVTSERELPAWPRRSSVGAQRSRSWTWARTR